MQNQRNRGASSEQLNHVLINSYATFDNDLLERLSLFLQKAFPSLSAASIIDTKIRLGSEDNKLVILDVGCGEGLFLKSLMRIMRRRISLSSELVGLDIFRPSLVKAKNYYSNVVQCDVRFLPIKNSSCNLVVATEIIEHLSKKNALKLISDLEHISKKYVVVSCPVGANPKEALEHANPCQAHISEWAPIELKEFGFEVYGLHGLRFFRHERGELKFRKLSPLLLFISMVTQLFFYKFAPVSYEMLGFKEKEKNSDEKSL